MDILPKRKHPRLKEYDYSQPGYYYVTIHSAQGAPPLSSVGRGLAPAVSLSSTGKLVEEQLLLLQKHYPYARIDKYVLMPDHIHFIVELMGEVEEKRPGIPDIVCAFKSLATRICNKARSTPGIKQFQTSFYETVLRNEQAYKECWRYIEENPLKWSLSPENR